MGGVERRRALIQGVSPGWSQGQPGLIAGPPAGQINAFTLAANLGYFSRFVAEEELAVTKIAFVVSTLDAANPTVDVGIYDATTLQRLGSSGAVAGFLNATGLAVVSLTATTTIPAGTVCYAALSSNSASVAVVQGRSANTATNWLMFGGTPPNLMAAQKAAAHPLPASVDPLATTTNTVPLLAVRTN